MSTNYKKVWKRITRFARKDETSAVPFIILGVGLGAVAIAGAAILALNPKARTEAQRLARRVGEFTQDRLLSAKRDNGMGRRDEVGGTSDMSDAPNGLSSYREQEMSFGS